MGTKSFGTGNWVSLVGSVCSFRGLSYFLNLVSLELQDLLMSLVGKFHDPSFHPAGTVLIKDRECLSYIYVGFNPDVCELCTD